VPYPKLLKFIKKLKKILMFVGIPVKINGWKFIIPHLFGGVVEARMTRVP